MTDDDHHALVARLRVERDALRALLGKADVQLRILRYEGDLLARIDAALTEGGTDD